MAEHHEAILVSFRKKFLKNGWKEFKSPMPTFRPDVFAKKLSKTGRVLEEIVVEAEIKSTLFSNHTCEQIVLMNEYISHQRKKGISIRGFLIVPKGLVVLKLAKSLLSTYPGTPIKVLQF